MAISRYEIRKKLQGFQSSNQEPFLTNCKHSLREDSWLAPKTKLHFLRNSFTSLCELGQPSLGLACYTSPDHVGFRGAMRFISSPHLDGEGPGPFKRLCGDCWSPLRLGALCSLTGAGKIARTLARHGALASPPQTA